MKAKDLPISVLKTLELFDKKNDKLFKRETGSGDYLLKYVDSDVNSNFYFQITRADRDDNFPGSFKYHLSIKPKSEKSTEASGFFISGNKMEIYFDGWVNSLNYYASNKLFDNDPLLKQYEKEFFSDFELVDVDADTASYDFGAQLQIDTFLEQVNELLQESITEQNAEIIEEIKSEVNKLRETQTSLTKRKVFDRIGKIGAMIRRHSLPVFKSFMVTLGKTLLGIVMKQMVENSVVFQHLLGQLK
jgi:hypothetical protein